jgi:FkbM family methyltransferase
VAGILQTWIERRRYRRMVARMAGPKLLKQFAELYPRAFFVEIGANDGQSFDQIGPLLADHEWRGIMVEPVPYMFEKLRATYAQYAGVACENAAIADRDGRMPFFHFAEAAPEERASLPDFYDALGSFSRETVLSHAPELADRLVETEVPTLTFESLLARHGAEDLDLLVIDTEGYDWEILRRIDFARWRPRLVLYEHFHLRANDRESARRRLEQRGYETLEEGLDTWCLDPSEDDALTALWRTSEPALPGLSRFDG